MEEGEWGGEEGCFRGCGVLSGSKGEGAGEEAEGAELPLPGQDSHQDGGSHIAPLGLM